MYADPFERPKLFPERRAEVRHRVDLTCVVRRKYWRLTRARAIDLSADGMLLSFEGWIDEGTDLDVSFKAAEPAIWFDAHATVARVVHGRRVSDSGLAVGLQFEPLSAVAHVILRGHLRKLPRTPALRPSPPLVAETPDYAEIVRGILDGRG